MIDRTMLGLLADGAFHSGESLGAALSISRAAVWKRVGALRDAGLDVHSIPGKGYRLAKPLDLLDAAQIEAELMPKNRGRLDVIEIVQVTASTNDLLMSRLREGERLRVALLAEQQTAGRGRRGRTWVSPFAANLYLSISNEFPGGPATLDGLSLAVGIALCESLLDLGVLGVKLKWPNDLYYRGRKLGGILIEISGEASGPVSAVIGIGLNVQMNDLAAAVIDQPWTDLSAAGYAGTRNRLAAATIERVLHALDDFAKHGFAAFAGRWQAYDMVCGGQVDVLLGEHRISGEAAGVDAAGALLLRVGGEIHKFHGGEVSLRARA